MYRVTISDKNGIPRCWAEGSDVRETLEQSVRVTSEYLAMRPDTGPLHVARLDEFNVLRDIDEERDDETDIRTR